MNILKQLWQDTQSVLSDMSVTQRVAVTFLILTVGVWLVFAAWMGTTPGETGRRSLPMEVDPGDVNAVLDRLREKGVKSAEYDFASKRILVKAEEEKSAVIAMAEDGLLKDSHAYDFEQMLNRWSFADTRMRSEESMRLARANEVSRLIERLDIVNEAQVIYSDDARTSLFGVAHKKSAAVRVKTKLQKRLDEDVANTIISLVSSAKAGLDSRDVVVTDQHGNKFHTSAANGLASMGKQKWDTELALAEVMRRQLEGLLRQYVPNINYEGDVNVLPKYDVIFDYRESLRKDVLPGEVATSSTSTESSRTNRRPSEEPGVQPNARRAANLNPNGSFFIEEITANRKSSERTMQNSQLETATKFSPNVSNLTISAIIQLPYRLKLDDQGKPIQATNEMGDLLIDPENRQPMWAKESASRLTNDELDSLKRLIAQAANIPLAQIPEKIEVCQIDWTPPPVSPKGGEAPLAIALIVLRQNGTAIVTFIFFSLAVLIVYRYATRPIPTEVEEEIDQGTITLAMTASDDDEEEIGDVEWEKLRAKAIGVVQEDPKRAANLVKRWMRKE